MKRFPLTESIYAEYMMLRETKHIFEGNQDIINAIFSKIIKIPTIHYDKTIGGIIYDDDISEDVKKRKGRYQIYTGYNFDAYNRKFISDSKAILFRKKCQPGISVIPMPIQTQNIDFLNLSKDDYEKINILHPIFIQLYYGNSSEIGCLTRSDLVTKSDFEKMTDKQKNEYIEKIMTDNVTVHIDLAYIQSNTDLYSAIEHELGHIFLLCDPKKRYIDLNDLDNLNRISLYLNDYRYKDIIEKYNDVYNKINYYLMDNECEARINSIKTVMREQKDYYKKELSENKLSNLKAVQFIYKDVCGRLRKGYVFNKGIYDILKYSNEDDIYSRLLETYSDEKAYDEYYKVICFKLMCIINKSDIKVINENESSVIHYFTERFKKEKNIKRLKVLEEKMRSPLSKYIGSLCKRYEKYINNIKESIYYFYDELLYIKDEDDVFDFEL